MNNNFDNFELFSAWPIPVAIKTLLTSEEKWAKAFSNDPAGTALLLQTLSKQLKAVDYFSSLLDTQQFFEFLKELIKSKPQDSQVLKEINNINSDVFSKISVKKRFNSGQAKVAIEYLSLLKSCLEADHGYLLSRSEITIRPIHFLNLSKIRFESADLLSQFRHTLLTSFEYKKFLEDPIPFFKIISNLAKSLKKKSAENNERAAMQLFDLLGVLSEQLKTSQDLSFNTSSLEPLIEEKSRLIYRRFKPFVENSLLKYSYYKFFLTPTYHSDNVTQLCQSNPYRRQCISEFVRFIDSYDCAVDQFPDFLIAIKNNKHSQTELDIVCNHLRGAESFVPWMEETFDLKFHYNVSRFNLYLSASKKDLLIDKFLFERDDPLEEYYSVPATYFPAEKPPQNHSLLGSAYTYSMNTYTLVHEYTHHLTALFINNLELDLTLTEGLAELNSVGVCSERRIRDLRNFVNDTFIFEFFKVRKFPAYISALKWVAYLIDEQPELFKTLMGFIQKNDTEGFYVTRDKFIDNFNKQKFVTWSQQQVNICNTYLNIFPDGHQSPAFYLKDLNAYLDQTQNITEPKLSLTKRDLLSQATALGLFEGSVEESSTRSKTKEMSAEIWQGVELGISLPLATLFAGMTSAIMDDVGLIYKDKHPSLPAFLNNGFKPFIFAATSASLNTVFFDPTIVEIEERFARFFIYFVMNYLAVVIAQPINESLAGRIQNKALSFLIQMLTWTMLWNPSLFLSERCQLFSTLFLQVQQALSFKVGGRILPNGKKDMFAFLG